jgi:hypothetical protein
MTLIRTLKQVKKYAGSFTALKYTWDELKALDTAIQTISIGAIPEGSIGLTELATTIKNRLIPTTGIDKSKLATDVTTILDTQVVSIFIQPDTAAADNFERAVFIAPYDLDIVAVILSLDGDIGQATDYMNLFLNEYKQADGTSRQNIGLINATNENMISKWQPEDIIVPIGSLSTVLEGNTLVFKKIASGDGQAFPGGAVQIIYSKHTE